MSLRHIIISTQARGMPKAFFCPFFSFYHLFSYNFHESVSETHFYHILRLVACRRVRPSAIVTLRRAVGNPMLPRLRSLPSPVRSCLPCTPTNRVVMRRSNTLQLCVDDEGKFLSNKLYSTFSSSLQPSSPAMCE